MEVPTGSLAKLWNFLVFLPYFLSLFILANLKGLLMSPIASGVIGAGNSAVIIGLCPAHFIWTYYCVSKTRKVGLVLKIAVLVLLPIPLVFWLVLGITCSVVGGAGYGYFAPLIATFEAVGENVTHKFYHCFFDGVWSTLEGSCTVVRDFTDFSFHSYFSYMDELIDNIPSDMQTIDIKLSRLPASLLVTLVALSVDILSITGVAVWKSPYMLVVGWKRLFEDLLGREGPFSETVCVPFAALAIILWPAAVIAAVIATFLSSFFLALYAGVIVHQEDSLKMGFAYIVAVVSIFDEYANDLLYLREGSCLPRPRYRKNSCRSPLTNPPKEGIHDNIRINQSDGKESFHNDKLVSERSRTLKGKIQQYKPIQVLDWLFKCCEEEGKKLFHSGLVEVKDIEDCVANGNFKKLGVVLPAWCVLKLLISSARSDSDVCMPRDKVWEWFVGPLSIMKEQIRNLRLEEDEEAWLGHMVMKCKNERPEDWDGVGFPSDDSVKRAQLQAIIRRLQGIVGSMTRMPTFRRRFQNLVKVLCLEAVKSGVMEEYVVESFGKNQSSSGHGMV